MAVHKVERRSSELVDDSYARPLAQEALPKFRMPDGPSESRVAYEVVRGELSLDGNSSLNLATFCTTWVEPEMRILMAETLDKNMIDKDEYPQTAEIESRCVHMLADLWHAPDEDAIGCSTTGSSEAAMLAGLALKWRWRKAREARHEPTDRPNLVCGPVQVCWEKFARYFDVELRQVPLEPGATGLLPHQLREYVDENTIGVVAILGVTYTCAYEPVARIAAELDSIAAETGLDIPVHVDAASGGFVAPFTEPGLVWDFRLPRVASINASGHKYGLAPLGVGWVVWRRMDLLPEELVFRVDYLGGDMPTFALNFSRPASQIIAQYFIMLRLGREGYQRVQQSCVDTAQWLADRIGEIDGLELLHDARGGLPAVSYRLREADRWSLYDLTDQLRMRGWQVPAYPLPPHRDDTIIQRVLIRHGTSRDKAGLLLDDLRRGIDRLNRISAGEHLGRAGFHH